MTLAVSLVRAFHALLLVLSIAVAFSGHVPYVSIGLLFYILFSSAIRIPFELSWSKDLGYPRITFDFFITILMSILAYGLIYWRHGLIIDGVQKIPTLTQAIYFSVTTWTTLGYGDYHPPDSLLLITSAEALNGLFFTSLFIAAIVMWLDDAVKESVAKEERWKGAHRITIGPDGVREWSALEIIEWENRHRAGKIPPRRKKASSYARTSHATRS